MSATVKFDLPGAKLQSTSFDWLVVTGNTAKLHGTTDNSTFLNTATDACTRRPVKTAGADTDSGNHYARAKPSRASGSAANANESHSASGSAGKTNANAIADTINR